MDTLEEGQRAYDQARAFEALRQRQLPLVYIVFTLLLAGLALTAFTLQHRKIATLCLVSSVLFGIFASANWRRLRAMYARNMTLLTHLEARHGEDLPWLQVERHLEQLEKLKAELADELTSGE